MEEIEELKQKLNEAVATTKQLEEKIKELEEEKNCKRWKAKYGEKYYYIDEAIINDHYEANDITDNALYERGNYFKTQREAQIVAEKLKIYTKLKDLALRLNKGKEIDWNDDTQNKYHLYYHHDYGICKDVNLCYQHLGTIHCLDEEFDLKAIKEIGEKNLKKLFI